MLSERSIWILALSALLLPLLGGVALLWRRFYNDQEGNTARRVFKNSAVPTAMRLLVRALDLVFLLVFNEVAGNDDIGTYALAALLIAMYLGTFTDFGLGVLLTREVAKDREAGPRLFGVTLGLRLLLVAISFPLVGLVIGTYQGLAGLGLSESISLQGQQAMWILALTLVPGAFSNAVTALYNASERMEVPAVMEVASAILSFFGRVAALLLGFGILGVAWSAVGVSAVTALLFFLLLLRDFFRPRITWDWSLMAAIVPLALPLMLNNLLNAVFFRFDMFLVKAFGGGRGDLLLASYNSAYQITSIAMIVPSVVTFAIFPALARRGTGERAALVEAQNRTLQALLLLALPLAVGMAALAPDFIRFIARDNAAEQLPLAGNVLAILAWFLPFSFVNGLIQYVLIAINQQRAITRAFVIAAAFNLVTNLIFIPRYGLYAAATITILSEIVLLLVFLPLLRREGLVPPLIKLAWRPTLGALLMGGTILAVYAALHTSLGWVGASIGAGLVAVPVYIGAISILGAFGAEERALARRVLGR